MVSTIVRPAIAIPAVIVAALVGGGSLVVIHRWVMDESRRADQRFEAGVNSRMKDAWQAVANRELPPIDSPCWKRIETSTGNFSVYSVLATSYADIVCVTPWREDAKPSRNYGVTLVLALDYHADEVRRVVQTESGRQIIARYDDDLDWGDPCRDNRVRQAIELIAQDLIAGNTQCSTNELLAKPRGVK